MDAYMLFPPNVLKDRVNLDAHAVEKEKWDKILFSSKKAYGCGKRGQDVVDGLALFARRVDYPEDLTSSLSIGITDKSLRFIHKELGDDRKRLDNVSPRVDMHVQAYFEIAGEHLAVLTLLFRLRDCIELFYYLVYDSKAASLSMIPCLPAPRCGGTYTPTPVVKRSGSGGDFVLVLLARDRDPCSEDGMDQGVIGVCDPETRAKSASSQNGISPWEIIRRSFPAEVKEPFFADVMFSSNGQAFWADLLQGLVYCNVHGGNLIFLGLPRRYQVDFLDDEMDTEKESLTEPSKMSRTIGCVRGSICFVRIDRVGVIGDEVVKMFTKDLPGGQWRRKAQLTAKQLWELDGFEAAGLPKVAPEYPILMPDGSLCVKLCDKDEGYICSIDLSSMSLLWYGGVGDYQTMDPIIVHSDLFETKHVRRNRIRKLAEHPASHRHEARSSFTCLDCFFCLLLKKGRRSWSSAKGALSVFIIHWIDLHT